MMVRTLQFLAIIFTALALVPAGAHLAELANKINLPQADYFIVQGIYRGWALFGIAVVGAIVFNLLLAFVLWRQRPAFWFALAGFVLVAITLVIFFIWTQPANLATEFWTSAPENWEALRRQWEYTHATSAVLTFIALCSVVLATLLTLPPSRA
jgi:hypothetical protein